MGAAGAVGTGTLGAANVEGLYLLLTAFICSSLTAALSVWALCMGAVRPPPAVAYHSPLVTSNVTNGEWYATAGGGRTAPMQRGPLDRAAVSDEQMKAVREARDARAKRGDSGGSGSVLAQHKQDPQHCVSKAVCLAHPYMVYQFDSFVPVMIAFQSIICFSSTLRKTDEETLRGRSAAMPASSLPTLAWRLRGAAPSCPALSL